MAIRVTRNNTGNCINFVGSTQPAYWNACLTAQANANNPNNIDIVNDIISDVQVETVYEFFNVPYTEFADRDGNVFNNVTETIAYINANANVAGLDETGVLLEGVDVDFRLDDTHTTVLLDNGYALAVNSIKAVADQDGTVHIHAISTGTPQNGTYTSRKHFSKLEVGRVSIDGTTVSGGLNDVTNALNELFTGTAAVGAVISDPFATAVADVSGVNATYTLEGVNAVDPVGDDIAANGAQGNTSTAGLKTTDTINEAGEYFTFDIRNAGLIEMGLIHTQASYDAGNWVGTQTYADPTTFCVTTNVNAGFQWAWGFNGTGTHDGSGADGGYVAGPAKSDSANFEALSDWTGGTPVKVRVGIDENSYAYLSTLQDDGLTWVMHGRSDYPLQGEYHLGVKLISPTPRVYTQPKVHELTGGAPTLYFRYVESPDGVFQYPLFATQEEANYYDTEKGGSGTNTAMQFVDDPSFATWYAPDTDFTNNGTVAPTNAMQFKNQPMNWTEISTVTNASLVPTAFAATTVQVNENANFNYNVTGDLSYTTTVTDNDGSGFTLIGTNIEGTAPEVTGDYNANPSTDYTFTVTRTNSFGSSTGTLTIQVNNMTAPSTVISNFHHEGTSVAMVDSDTMDNGSVVRTNNTLADGERFVILKSYVEANILPALQASGDKYYIGLGVSGVDWSTLEDTDFDTAIVFQYYSATAHRVSFQRDGAIEETFIVNSMTNALYDYAIEAIGTSAWLIGCNINNISTEASPTYGGSFSHTYEASILDNAAPHTLYMAAKSTQADISTTGISVITTPTASTDQTNWDKAVDFSGNSERLEMASGANTNNVLKLGGSTSQVSAPTTSGNTVAAGHPWATTIVFKTDNNGTDQRIWNMGEGIGSTDDNIYLRQAADDKLYFGWGRDGDLCEMLIHPANTGTGWTPTASNWYGIYIAHNGTRYGSNNTTSLMADAFDIRLMGSSQNWATVNGSDTNLSVASDWTITGDGRMNRGYDGNLYIGGVGANRNFYGKVASMVVTTLECGVAMPATTEIEKMIVDPIKWLDEDKEGNNYRKPTETTSTTGFAVGGTASMRSTQVWLMGDGTNDSFANGIRNQVQSVDNSETKMTFTNMVSTDIENVSISGLS